MFRTTKSSRLTLLLTLLLFYLPQSTEAQQAAGVYHFIDLPYTSHVAALGGVNVSAHSASPDLVFQNPALLNQQHSNKVMLNYMNYVGDINIGSALYSHKVRKNGAWAAGVNFINYGRFRETTPENVELGTFTASESAISGSYSHQLTKYIRGGVSTKLIYSSLERYNSMALVFDFGLNYFNPRYDLSLGATIKNVGATFIRYTDTNQTLPWDIQFGISQKLKYAPFRYSVTLYHLNKWDLSNFREVNNSDGTTERQKDNFVTTLFKHMIFAIDFVPSDNFRLTVGFNPKRQSDFGFNDLTTFAGFSIGAGVNIKKININTTIYQQHTSGLAVLVGLTWNLNKGKL